MPAGWIAGCSRGSLSKERLTQIACSLVCRRLAGGQRVRLRQRSPGSPLTDAAIFPARGTVWDFNYRGSLEFLAQARAQQETRALRVEDGWRYFLHGWTSRIADIFGVEIPPRGALLGELGAIWARLR